MHKMKKKQMDIFERMAIISTNWIGSTNSILAHTVFFIVSFSLYFLGINMEKILLIVTTIVSLEAIYLAIFIQMSVNRQMTRLKEVAEDIDEIQEDVDEIQEDIDEIQEDIDDDDEEEEDKMLERIENTLGKLIEEVIELKKQHNDTLIKK